MPRAAPSADPLPPPTEAGYRSIDKTYWCDCEQACHGVLRQVPHRTYFNHRLKARERVAENAEIPSPVLQARPAMLGFDTNENMELEQEDFGEFSGNHNQEHHDRHEERNHSSPLPDHGHGEDSTVGCAQGLDPDDPCPIVTLEDLRLALDYVDALKEARLESSGLDPGVVHALQNPVSQLLKLEDDPDLKLSIKLYIALGNSSQANYTAAREAILDRYLGSKVLTFEQVKSKVENLSGVTPIIHDMCVDTCMAFTGPLAHLDKCKDCHKPRYDLSTERSAARQRFYTIPIGPQLQALWRSEKSAKAMSYRRDKTAEILRKCEKALDGTVASLDVGVYEDYLCGYDYLNAVISGNIKEDDMVLMLSIDGAQLYEHKASDCWIYIWIIMDLPPNLRYKKRHVIPGGFIPGPNKPKNIDSFIFPGLYHLAALQIHGLSIWNPLVDRVFYSHPFFIFGTADGPGMTSINGLVGHNGYIGCRTYCPIRGRRNRDKSTKYYPVIYKPEGDLPEGSNHPDVELSDIFVNNQEVVYKERLNEVLASPNITQYKTRRRDSGIAKPSIISGLSKNHRLAIPNCFPSDVMHLVNLNITDVLLGLFRGTLDCDKDDNILTWDWAVLTGDDWDVHGALVAELRKYLPGSYDRPPRNPAKKISSGYKAREFMSYVFGYLPGLLYGVLPDVYWRNFCKLVWGIRLLLQRVITAAELAMAHKALAEFCVEFEKLYVQRKTSRIHFVRQCIHNLLHLATETTRCGPLCLLAQWTIERTIGNLGEEIKQPSNPFKNLSERGLRRAQLNALLAMTDLIPEKSPPGNSIDLEDGYILLHPCDAKTRKMSLDEKAAYSRFRAAQNAPPLHEDRHIEFTRWARLRLPTLQIARTAWKEQQRSPDTQIRISRMVKVEENDTLYFGEVMYFFRAQISSVEHCLAMVSLCEGPNKELLELSSHALWVTKLESGRLLRVFDVKAIKAVVALLPFPKLPGYSFIFEDFGLNVAHLGCSDNSLDGDEDILE